MLTATITAASPELDTVTVFHKGVEHATVSVVPTGSSADYEAALAKAGFTPVAWDGTQWTVEAAA